jgi:very-short-patch-repair endonuclease
MVLLYNHHLKSTARELRLNMTQSEKLIWSMIRGKKILGIQFYRQKTIGTYIVDFYAPVVNLVIEIDGKHHLIKENKEQDQFRDAYLQELGLRVLRFRNDEVKNALPKVIQKIRVVIQEQNLNPL